MPSFDEVQRQYRAVKEVMKNQRRNWMLNIAFFLNEQWVAYDPYTNRLRTIIQNTRKPRLTSNLIRPRIRREFGSLIAQQLKYDVRTIPVTPDSMAKDRVAQSYLDYLWTTYDYPQSYADVLLWVVLCGYGVVQWYFDPNAGPVYNLNGERITAGDPLLDSCSPFEIYFDPHARSVDEASWVIKERLRSKEYVLQKYGKEVSTNAQYDMIGTMLGRLRMQNMQARIPSAQVAEYWMRPNSRYPKGYYLVFSGKDVLYEGDNPYAGIEGCEMPFAVIRHTPIPGEPTGDSTVTDLRQINVIYNRLRNDILENSVKLSNPPLIAPKGSLWQEPSWEPGEVIYTNPLVMQGQTIDQVKIEPFPAQLPNMLLRLEQEADEIVSVIRQPPRGIRSGDQLALYIQQADDSRKPLRDQYVKAVQKSLNGVLALARAFCDMPRFISISGDEHGSALFKGSDIPENAQVRVIVKDKKTPMELQQDLNFAMALADRGIIQDPRTLIKVYSQDSDLSEVMMDVELDTKQAQRENDKLKEGIRVPVEEWHNHVVHRLEHNRFRKTAEYEQLPQKAKKAFAEHDAMHQQFLAQLQEQQKPGKSGKENLAS